MSAKTALLELEAPEQELELPAGKTEKLLEAENDSNDFSLADRRLLILERIVYLTEELADPAKSEAAKEKIQDRIDHETKS